jgi:hypothetical protein
MGMLRPPLMLPAAVLVLVVLTSGCMAGTDKGTSPGGGASSGSTPASASSGSTPASARVSVEINHCWVEPVSFDGEQWNVPFENQFGWGGPTPKRWQGAGIMVRAGVNEARFEDDGGATVLFRPMDDPSVRLVEHALCD